MAKDKKHLLVLLRASDLEALANLRRAEDPIPTEAEMIRRCIQAAERRRARASAKKEAEA